MTTRPYELLARFAPDGTVAGVSVRTITTVNGRDYESDPEPLSGESDPAFAAFAEAFAASAVSERDALQAQLSPLQATVSAQAAEIEQLTAELDALRNPTVNPRRPAPYVFLTELLKPEEVVALQTSPDPLVIVGRAKLQTIITYVDLDLAETMQLVQYMEAIGLIGAGRAAQILAGESWQ